METYLAADLDIIPVFDRRKLVFYYNGHSELEPKKVLHCKDCKYYNTESIMSDYAPEGSSSNCSYFKDFEGTPHPVHPYGFCIWGEA